MPEINQNQAAIAKAIDASADMRGSSPKPREKAPLSKEARIAKRRRELLKIYKSIDANKLKVVMALIERAAFYSVSLEDLEAELNACGWTETYKNGNNQEGVKRSAAADAHISITKNLTAITKQLLELCPAQEKRGKLGAFLAPQ